MTTLEIVLIWTGIGFFVKNRIKNYIINHRGNETFGGYNFSDQFRKSEDVYKGMKIELDPDPAYQTFHIRKKKKSVVVQIPNPIIEEVTNENEQ